jgi:hypothetical protein
MGLARSVLAMYESNISGDRYEDWYDSLSDELQKQVSDIQFLSKASRLIPLMSPRDYFTYVVRPEREGGGYMMEGYMLDAKRMELVILGEHRKNFKRRTFVFVFQREKWLLKEVEDT